MWGIPDAPFVPDSEEDFRVVYGEDEPGLDEDEAAQQGRVGPRRRYEFAQGSSALSFNGSEASQAAAGGGAERPAGTQHPTERQQPPRSPAASGGCVPDSGGASPDYSEGEVEDAQHQPVSLVHELQTVLHGFTQQLQHQQPQAHAPGQQQQQQQWGGASGGQVLVPQDSSQRQQLEGQQQQPQQKDSGGWRTRRDVVRRINHVSPALPPAAQLAPPAAGSGRPTSAGRRWRQAQTATDAAAMAAAAFVPTLSRQVASPAAPAGDAGPAAAGGGAGAGTVAFFSVDEDLLQAHVHRQVQQAAPAKQQGRRPQPRTVQWQSPQAALDGAAAEHTPLQDSQRVNPLASLLGGGGGGSAAKPRAATTGGKARGRHPIYGQVAAVQQASQASQAPPAAPSSTTGSRLRDGLGLRDAPLTSPRQAQQRRPPQQQHSRFAIRDPAPAAIAANQQQEAAAPVPAAVGLRQLTGETPASASRLPHQFQPRPRRPPSPGEQIVDEGEVGEGADVGPGESDWWQQQPWERPAAVAAADSFRTPGQPLRRSWLDDGEDIQQQAQQQLEQQQQQPQQQQQQQPQQEVGAPSFAAPAAAPAASLMRGGGSEDRIRNTARGGASTGAGGSAGRAGGGAMSLQRAFVAQLQPVSSSVAAATLQQQRQRLAGAAGLHARMQALLAAEKAAQEESPAGPRAAAGPRLTVLDKQLEGSITKCLCRCDSVAAAALGSAEVVALFQSRTAQRVDTAPGSIVLLRQPWRVMPLAGSHAPAVLCFAASVG